MAIGSVRPTFKDVQGFFLSFFTLAFNRPVHMASGSFRTSYHPLRNFFFKQKIKYDKRRKNNRNFRTGGWNFAFFSFSSFRVDQEFASWLNSVACQVRTVPIAHCWPFVHPAKQTFLLVSLERKKLVRRWRPTTALLSVISRAS